MSPTTTSPTAPAVTPGLPGTGTAGYPFARTITGANLAATGKTAALLRLALAAAEDAATRPAGSGPPQGTDHHDDRTAHANDKDDDFQGDQL